MLGHVPIVFADEVSTTADRKRSYTIVYERNFFFDRIRSKLLE